MKVTIRELIDRLEEFALLYDENMPVIVDHGGKIGKSSPELKVANRGYTVAHPLVVEIN